MTDGDWEAVVNIMGAFAMVVLAAIWVASCNGGL